MRGPHFNRFDKGHMWHVEELETTTEGAPAHEAPEPNRGWWYAAAAVCFIINIALYAALVVYCGSY